MGRFGLVCCVVLLGCLNLRAATLYVDLNSTGATAPYADWSSAATNIQDAVDAAVDGDTVLITNGHYLLASEVSVTNAITLQSINGPGNTLVDGQGAVRCFNLGGSACVIEGLTITNGYGSHSGGGVYCSDTTPIVTNCTLSGNSALLYGGGIYSGTANNCTLCGNTAGWYGGGIYSGTANNCTLSGNYASENGGGLYYSTANNCTITGNRATRFGGGMVGGTANHCTISGNTASSGGGGMAGGTANHCAINGNTASSGGGMDGGTANNCTLSGNTATENGGGMIGTANNCTINDNSAKFGGGLCGGTANHCIISGNAASSCGGGVYDGTANHCTISGNTASSGGGMYGGKANNCTLCGNTAGWYGGGMRSGSANNCIIWYNTAPSGTDFFGRRMLKYCCSPDVIHGVDGNITNAPVFVDAANGDYRLAAGSPCIDSGGSYVVGELDLAGLPRIAGDVVDMGAYEYQGAGIGDQDSDGLPDDWEQACFSSLDAMADGNNDGDTFSNLAEYIAGTDPTDATSCFAITNCCLNDGLTVEWSPSVTGRLYRVIWSDSLTNSAPIVLQDNIEYPQDSYTDTEHNDESAGFYRVEVRMP